MYLDVLNKSRYSLIELKTSSTSATSLAISIVGIIVKLKSSQNLTRLNQCLYKKYLSINKNVSNNLIKLTLKNETIVFYDVWKI